MMLKAVRRTLLVTGEWRAYQKVLSQYRSRSLEPGGLGSIVRVPAGQHVQKSQNLYLGKWRR